MNYYNEIKEQIINNELVKKIKDYSKNRIDLNTYYNVVSYCQQLENTMEKE